MPSATDPTIVAPEGAPLADPTDDTSPVREPPLAPPGSGTKVGRYVLLEPLGTGGMAVVYLAYDPKLRRNVAIKLLRPQRSHDAQDQARLVREAQALAQVSHPNLVQVHDVGTWGDGVFMAMEYVRGPSLAQWLIQRPRWRVGLHAVLAAGHGLAAAHAAGLVHRDLKPANVLMGDDGRVRLVDFGLARIEASDEPESVGLDAIRSSLVLASAVTEIGMVMGTPAYMAPEQHTGDEVDARSDQFSLCATLYEVVHGQRPFRGDTTRALLEAKLHGPSPPARAKVPAWLRRALARGLAPVPADRFPSVQALLDELERGLGPRRRRRLAIAGALGSVVVVAAVGYALLSARAPDERCEPPPLAGWDEARREAVGAAFTAVDLPHGSELLELVTARLDERAAAWVAMQRDACEATHVRGEQSDELLDLRTACLKRRATELDAGTALLSHADADVIGHAVELVDELTPMAVCANAEALRAAVPSPEDPRVADEVEALQAELASVQALNFAGKKSDATELAQHLLERARATGYAPLRAEILLELGRALDARDPSATEPYLREAITAAAEGHDDRLQATAWIELVTSVGQLQGRHAEALSLVVGAEAAVVRSGDDPNQRADLEATVGTIEHGRGRFELAIHRYERAQAIILASHGAEDPRLRIILNNHGVVMLSLGRLEEAREQFQHGLEHARSAFGPHHPYVADSLLNLGNVELERGRGTSALEFLEQALAILRGVPDQDRRRIAQVLSNLAVASIQAGDLDAAHEHALHARAELEVMHGPDYPLVAAPIDSLGLIAMARGDLPLAALYFEEAVALLERTVGKQHPNHALVATHLGQLQVSQGRVEEGAATLDAARQVLRGALEAEHPAVLAVDAAWAEAELERGHAEVARPLLERVTERVADPTDKARFAFALARAVVATGGDRDRALALARRAEAFYAERGLTTWQQQVSAWLAARGP
jgi:eukaryotic-like serine/threonine-protein kinase